MLTTNFDPSGKLFSLSRAMPPLFGSPLMILTILSTFPSSPRKPRKKLFSFPPSQAFPTAALAREGDVDDARREMRCCVGLPLLKEEEEAEVGRRVVSVLGRTLMSRRRFP